MILSEIKRTEPSSILLLSPFIYPEPISTGKYNTKLAKVLVRAGHQVEIVAFHPIYPEWKVKMSNKTLPGVVIRRGGGWLRFPKSLILRRILLEVAFFFHAFRFILVKRVDVIVPVYPPSLLFFLLAPFIPKGTKKIAIVHDIQGVMAIVSKSPMQTLMMQLVRFLERRSYAVCDKLIFVSKSMGEWTVKNYKLAPEKISVRYPFVSLEKKEFTGELSLLFSPEYKHVVYSGAIGEKQNPYELLKLYKTIVTRRKDVCCHFFSNGPMYEELMKANSESNERIKFHGLVDENSLYELYMRSDLQIIPQKEGTAEGAIPSKLPNIMSAGTPIFAICDKKSELAQILQNSGIGFCAHSRNIEQIALQLSDFLDSCIKISKGEFQKMTSDFVASNFSIVKLIDEILS
jgi:glycosyltransferase involved in cell wall biosynthesis